MALSNMTAATNSGSGTAITVTAPSGIASGDILIVCINHNNETNSVADNNGSTPCTLEAEVDYFAGSGGGGLTVFRRVCGGSEPSSYAFTLSGSNRWAIVAFKVRGGDNTTPIDTGALADGSEASSTSPSCPTVTTVTDLAWAIAMAGTDGTGNGTFSAVPSGYTEIGTVNTQQPVSVAYKEITPAGATGAVTFTTSGGNWGTMTQFGIRPAASGASQVPRSMHQYRQRRAA